jgi:hypothetical protein
MPINRDLNVAPYYDDFDITRKYYRVLFKPGYALQARELTQLQTTLQNQIEQFGDNIFKEGSIVKGCTFTELNSLSYVKVADGITPSLYVDKVELATNNTTIEYYYELESSSGLRAYIVSAANGFQSKAPDLNTFFINYLNTVETTQQKTFAAGETLNIKEYRVVKQISVDNLTQEQTITEALEGGETVKTTTVATFSTPIGKSFGLNVSEGVIFQKGHFLFAEDQTIVLVKYMPATAIPGEYAQPHSLSVGFRVNEEIINSQQDTSLLDNANGSENENAPGADRLKLSPLLVSISTASASADPSFFALRRYENGSATQIRDVSQYNVIGEEMARRTYEESGDYVTNPFDFNTVRKNGVVNIKVGPGTVYTKGYRVQNTSDVFLAIEDVTSTSVQQDQPISFEYGGFVDVANSHNSTGVIDLDGYQNVNLLASDGTSVLGSAVVKNYTTEATRVSSAPINSSTKGRIYLFGVRMKDAATEFADVRYVKLGVGGGTGKIEIDPVIRRPNASKLVFDPGQSYIKGVSDIKLHTRKKVEITLSTGSSQATITPASGETFTADSLDHILAIGQSNTRLVVTSPEITGQGNLTFQVSQVAGTLTVYCDVRISPNVPRAKQSFDIFVKTTFLSSGGNAKTRYTLGLSDAYKLLSVTDGTTDYTGSFKLVPNQKDDFYDHSYIEQVSGRPTPPNNTTLTIKVSVFRPDSSGVYNLFTVNSYSGIDPADIPYFNGKSGTYNLRDCIDLRPHRIPLAGVTYSTNEAGAPTISTGEFVGLPTYTTSMFSSSDKFVFPSIETVNSVDIEYYLNRTDVVAVNSYGDFYLIRGEEAARSQAPSSKDKTPIAEVYVPGYPTYTHQEARDRGKVNYGVKVTSVGTKNYTMQDIKKVEDQIERLAYYVTLSALESDTKNLLIRDANGNDRFKNGIIVDPFNDLSIADIRNPNFNASVDFIEKSLAPAVQTVPINLKVSSASGTQTHRGILATMAASSSSVPIISQEFATNFRTATSNFYLYNGEGFLTPEYDGAYDVVTNPQNVSLDLTDAFDSLVDVIQEFYPLTSSSSQVIGSTRSSSSTQAGRTTTTINDTTQTIRDTVNQIQTSIVTNEIPVGDFVTDIRFNPYMRSREIKVLMYGLRPNTRHYFFFGGVNVTASVAPAILKNGAIDTDNPFDSIGRSGEFGASVFTNSSGELYAVFSIPDETFYVGDTLFDVADVDVFENIGSASISKGTLTYRAYNFSVDKTELTMSTRAPDYSVATTTTTRTVTNRVVTRRTESDRDNGPSNDPLAQTFFIKGGMAPESNCLYVSKVDLFFKRKSLVNGVTVMIREVVNGYPAYEIVALSKTHLTSSQVNVSEDASIATTVTFRSPIRLDTEKEYTLVIMPDAADPDFLVFTSKVGGTDLITNVAVTQDAFDGSLFTSTNNRTWISYQDEDIKFKLYRYAFNVGEASITLETDGVEFFSLSDWANTFRNGELVYTLKANTINASFTTGSDIIIGTGIGSVYQVGDYIYVVNGSGVKDLLRVTAVAGNNNSVTVSEAASFTGTFSTRAAVAGKVNYYNASRPGTIYLEASSARTDRKFDANSSIYGITSSATGTIGSVDDVELSFIRPSIERITDKSSSIRLTASVVDPTAPIDTPYTKPMAFNNSTTFNQKGCVVYSKSNDPSGAKNLKLTIDMTNNVDTSTPVIDVENALIFASRYFINNNSGDDADATYISRSVTLAEGFDAEDFRLYVTGYRPNGTDIEAYIRLLNASDPLTIEDNPWIPLDLVEGVGVFSSTTNLNDFREYMYEITDTVGSNYGKTSGVAYYTNPTGKYTGYKNFQIRLVMKTSKIGSVPRMLDYRGVALE